MAIKTLGDYLNELIKRIPDIERKLKKGIIQNAKDAADVAVLAAREATPHDGDGKPRGFNTITGELEAHWDWEYSGGGDTLGSIRIFNSMSYAAYVQYGHVMHQHFVPWLYIDGMGTISYETNHNLPLFGLVVGTKTKYVEGRDMIGPANEAFHETFKQLTLDLFKEVIDLDID